MKVLHVNHTAYYGGAERSLLELLAALPETVTPVLAAPEGRLTSEARALGIEVARTSAADASMRITAAHTPDALVGLWRLAGSVRRLSTTTGAELVHANTVRAGLAAVVAGASPVVHVRDCLPSTLAADLIRQVLATRAATVVANSRYTAACIRARVPRAPVRVAYNGVDTTRLRPDADAGVAARRMLGLDADQPVLAVVGQIVDWKGQADAIVALARLRTRFPHARLLVVGEPNPTPGTRYDNAAYAERLTAQAKALDLTSQVTFLGHRDDVREILQAVDVLLVPSWQEPFGRVVLEGMAVGRPVVATSVGGPAEIIRDGIDGLLLPPRDPTRWATVLESLLADAALRGRLGACGRARVTADFTVGHHARRMLEIFHETIDRARGHAP